MKEVFNKALSIFKKLILVFSLIYWVWVIIDDWIFIEKYWNTNGLQYVGIWLIWFTIYAITLSVYYWGITSLGILVYFKIIKR